MNYDVIYLSFHIIENSHDFKTALKSKASNENTFPLSTVMKNN